METKLRCRPVLSELIKQTNLSNFSSWSSTRCRLPLSTQLVVNLDVDKPFMLYANDSWTRVVPNNAAQMFSMSELQTCYVYFSITAPSNARLALLKLNNSHSAHTNLGLLSEFLSYYDSARAQSIPYTNLNSSSKFNSGFWHIKSL